MTVSTCDRLVTKWKINADKHTSTPTGLCRGNEMKRLYQGTSSRTEIVAEGQVFAAIIPEKQ